MNKLAKNQVEMNGYLYHTNKSIENSGATISKNTKKIKEFIIAGKMPNGTNGVYVNVDK